MDDRESIMTEREESKSIRILLKISIESYKTKPFSKDDIRRDMAESLQIYMKVFTPQARIVMANEVNAMIEIVFEEYLNSHVFVRCGEDKYYCLKPERL